MIHDITERKKAETRIQNLLDEVRKEKDRLSSLINSISDEVWFADMQKNFTLANPVALKEFALGSGEIDVEKFAASLEVYHPDGSPRPVEEAPPLRALKGEEVRNLEEMIRTPGTGELRYRQVSSNPVRDASGSIVGSVSIVRDITELKKAEEELKQKNEDLNAANEELSSTQEELLQSFEELSMWEQELSKALAEKEVLLSEIHHRVKNNLTAFISLLSLDGSFEDTESGRTLRKDLQNRARSMALIHETLYRTGKFSNVDMEVYLKNLVNQITQSYEGGNNVHVFVEVHDATLDIARATTAGLIINELVTNSFKYAFPPGFDCMALRGEPGAIRVSFVHEDGIDVLRVSDNGCGLPAGLDPLATKSLGLKLVNFLASHQLQAEIAVRSDKGTEFIFRLNKREDEL
jgi:PAS domain S-box-containing protein